MIEKRFYRNSCKKFKKNFIKDLKHLKKLSKDSEQMILVDDNTTSVNKNYPFAVQIKPFEGKQDDKDLVRVFNTLMKFYQC